MTGTVWYHVHKLKPPKIYVFVNISKTYFKNCLAGDTKLFTEEDSAGLRKTNGTGGVGLVP